MATDWNHLRRVILVSAKKEYFGAKITKVIKVIPSIIILSGRMNFGMF